MLINGYNVAAEYVSKIILFVLIFLTIYSKPRRNKMIVTEWICIVLSFLAIELQLNVVHFASNPEWIEKGFLNVALGAYLILYLILIGGIFSYVFYIATGGQKSSRIYWSVLGIYYTIVIAIYHFSGRMWHLYRIKEDGTADLTKYIHTYSEVAILTSILALVLVIVTRKRLSKTTFVYLMVLVPMDIVLSLIQRARPDTIFSGITYVMPILVFYLMFHASPFEELTGCQSQYSLETRFADKLRHKAPFTCVYLEFPQLKYASASIIDNNVGQKIAEVSRYVERIARGISIHRVGGARYVLMLSTNDEQKVKDILNKIQRALDKMIVDASFTVYYKMVAVRSHQLLENTHMLHQLFLYFIGRISTNNATEVYFVSDDDYDEFKTHYDILLTLIDINNQNKLDDPRVLCYAQPIYSVSDGKFRSAEALIRLNLNGNIIYPDKFIALAEQHNCVHILTKIMLNKVCKIIKDASDIYDIDTITINCTAVELADPGLHDELIEIIDRNMVDRSKIRLELTESMMIKGFDVVKRNMDRLRDSGVQFYLDDFGTGYSNFERIINCNFNTIKFDKSMLYKAMDDEHMNGLVSYMVEAFKKRGFVVLMEGVEDDNQNQYCVEQGFDYIQGYKYAKPVPIEEAITFFAKK